jgi:hypothetical protein
MTAVETGSVANSPEYCKNGDLFASAGSARLVSGLFRKELGRALFGPSFAQHRRHIEEWDTPRSVCRDPCLYRKKTMSDRDKSLAAGMWEPGKDETICAGCYNDESPTWDSAEAFDFEKRKEEIAHPIPEDVKGKYIEIEKKLKAEKRARGEAAEEGAAE